MVYLCQLQKLVQAFVMLLHLGYGAVLVSNGELTVGQIVSFNVYLGIGGLADVCNW